jgi:hypothetical protein
MHIFVADARQQLQELWDKLYFSDDEILNFSPAQSGIDRIGMYAFVGPINWHI